MCLDVLKILGLRPERCYEHAGGSLSTLGAKIPFSANEGRHEWIIDIPGITVRRRNRSRRVFFENDTAEDIEKKRQ